MSRNEACWPSCQQEVTTVAVEHCYCACFLEIQHFGSWPNLTKIEEGDGVLCGTTSVYQFRMVYLSNHEIWSYFNQWSVRMQPVKTCWKLELVEGIDLWNLERGSSSWNPGGHHRHREIYHPVSKRLNQHHGNQGVLQLLTIFGIHTMYPPHSQNQPFFFQPTKTMLSQPTPPQKYIRPY